MSAERVFVCDRPGERLDRFLADRCTDLSRTRIKRLIADGEVTVEGATSNAGFRLKSGQSVTIRAPDPVPSHVLPQNIPIDVVYEDDHMLVVDKPAGMPVHPGVGHPDSTLLNAVLGISPEVASVGGTLRPGLVHRLDKDTSGLMAIAKTDGAHRSLSEQLKNRTVDKGYLALVVGRLEPPEAIIEAPVGRDPNDRKKMAIIEDGREALHPVPHHRAAARLYIRGRSPEDRKNAPDQGSFRIHWPPGFRRRDLRIPGPQTRPAVPPRREPGVRASCVRERESDSRLLYPTISRRFWTSFRHRQGTRTDGCVEWGCARMFPHDRQSGDCQMSSEINRRIVLAERPAAYPEPKALSTGRGPDSAA